MTAETRPVARCQGPGRRRIRTGTSPRRTGAYTDAATARADHPGRQRTAEPRGRSAVGITGTDVVVVGDGPAGSSVAVLLARAGASVTLLERAPSPRTADLGVALEPDGLAVLGGLGLDAALRRHDCRIDHRLALRRS